MLKSRSSTIAPCFSNISIACLFTLITSGSTLRQFKFDDQAIFLPFIPSSIFFKKSGAGVAIVPGSASGCGPDIACNKRALSLTYQLIGPIHE